MVPLLLVGLLKLLKPFGGSCRLLGSWPREGAWVGLGPWSRVPTRGPLARAAPTPGPWPGRLAGALALGWGAAFGGQGVGVGESGGGALGPETLDRGALGRMALGPGLHPQPLALGPFGRRGPWPEPLGPGGPWPGPWPGGPWPGGWPGGPWPGPGNIWRWRGAWFGPEGFLDGGPWFGGPLAGGPLVRGALALGLKGPNHEIEQGLGFRV